MQYTLQLSCCHTYVSCLQTQLVCLNQFCVTPTLPWEGNILWKAAPPIPTGICCPAVCSVDTGALKVPLVCSWFLASWFVSTRRAEAGWVVPVIVSPGAAKVPVLRHLHREHWLSSAFQLLVWGTQAWRSISLKPFDVAKVFLGIWSF